MAQQKYMDFYASIQQGEKKEIKLSRIDEHCENQEKPEKLQFNQEHASAVRRLQEHNANLQETVTALAQNCQKADDMMKQQAKLHAKASAQLQQHNSSLKETVETLTLSCKENEEKILLQTQLHTDQLRTLQSRDRTLKERCQSLAAFAEQHRLASMRHEEKHKSLAKDLQSMAAVQVSSEAMASEVKRLESNLKGKEREVVSLNTNVQSLQHKLETLQSSIQSLKQEHRMEITALGQKLENVSGKLQTAQTLLKASPDNNNNNFITKHALKSLKSSVEVMQLAHARGSSDSMRECLGDVGSVLEDLHGELESQGRLSSDWKSRVSKELGL
jgi:chromosome segregation ATPase